MPRSSPPTEPAWQGLVDELAGALGVALEEPARAQLGRLASLTARWNARLNLSGAREPRALVEVLAADALVLADRALIGEGARFLDVGAGAGAPSLPLLLLRPDLTATLVEPRRKRVAFLRTAIGTLDLTERARVEERRLEGAPLRGVPFDVALSRATFAPDEWLSRGAELASRVLVLVGAEPLPEPKPSDRAPLRRAQARRYELPFARSPRQIGAYEG